MSETSSLEQLRQLIGERLGPSEWTEVDQDRIDLFTKATDDPQWIHIDPVRAAAGPFGTTIAQGYLTMSLMVPLTQQIGLPLDPPPAMTINYGLNRLRFTAPIPSGSKIRAWAKLIAVDPIESGAQVTREVTIECEGISRPVLIAETVSRLVF